MRVRLTGVETRLGNNGIILHIADNQGRHVGKLRLGQATVEWCKGRTRFGHGRQIRLQRFIEEHLDEL